MHPTRFAYLLIMTNKKSIDKKQGEESTEFIKDPEKETRGYIFQKNSKTQLAIMIIAVAVLLIIAALYKSGVFLDQ
ncbi:MULTISPECIES: hypothetical protein [unclassified Robiginitalea]|uniref:hypothetical protein n=1 Tax=Robiginitalea TaxID=252306 RepID=UPI002349A1C3|nr:MULTISPECIES: hypothetical protein [unclassified Robiginitalea]MDC6352870.1 hypothetical protein [Robiginitalea sp. PM2]MDC6373963.1 hypothetical protein [Robiginitalea sp. SP8]